MKHPIIGVAALFLAGAIHACTAIEAEAALVSYDRNSTLISGPDAGMVLERGNIYEMNLATGDVIDLAFDADAMFHSGVYWPTAMSGNFTYAAVPEPASLAVWSICLGGLGYGAWRRKRKTA